MIIKGIDIKIVKGIESDTDRIILDEKGIIEAFKYCEEHPDKEFYEIIDSYELVEFWNKRVELQKAFKNLTIVSMAEHIGGEYQLVFQTFKEWSEKEERYYKTLEKKKKIKLTEVKKQKGLFEY